MNDEKNIMAFGDINIPQMMEKLQLYSGTPKFSDNFIVPPKIDFSLEDSPYFKNIEQIKEIQVQSLDVLKAIEKNTADIKTIIDLIQTSNENQDEILEILADIHSMAKEKTMDSAETKYSNVMKHITATVTNAETIHKLSNYANIIWTIVQNFLTNGGLGG